MVLSRITLDLESPAARRDLADAYEMHSTLMRFVDAGASKPLWRLERGRGTENAVVLVQTDRAPSPDALTDDGGYFLDFESRPNKLIENLQAGDRVYFRVRANATVKREGKRHGLVTYEDQVSWIDRQLQERGAVSIEAIPSEARREVFRRRRGGKPITVLGVTFDGTFEVANPIALRAAVESGIGHARSFGFGLVTLAR